MLFTGIKPEMFNTHVVHSLRDEIAEQPAFTTQSRSSASVHDPLDVFDSIADPAGRQG